MAKFEHNFDFPHLIVDFGSFIKKNTQVFLLFEQCRNLGLIHNNYPKFRKSQTNSKKLFVKNES